MAGKKFIVRIVASPFARGRRGFGIIGLAMVLWLQVGTVCGATYASWGGGANGYWSTDGNWGTFQGNYPSGLFTVGLIFGSGASRMVNTNDLVGKTFDGLVLFTNGYTLRGNTFNILNTLHAEYASGFSVIEAGVTFALGNGEIRVVNPGSTLWLAGPVTVNNQTLLIANNGTLFANGPWSGSGNYAVNFTGAGAVHLAADNNPLSGTHDVSGTLVVYGGLSNVLLNVSGTLNGGGSIGRVALSGGKLQPGYSFGTAQLTVLSNFTADAASILSFRLFDPNTSYDQLRFVSTNGTMSLGGCHLELLPGGTPIPGSTFTLIDKVGTNKVSSTFVGWPEGSRQFISNAFYQITYAGGDGNDVVVTVTNPAAIWRGAGVTAAWSLSANWSNNVVPGQNYDVIFPVAPATFTAFNDLPALQLGRLVFLGSNYHVGGASLPIRGGILMSNVSGANYLDSGVTLLADQLFTNVFGSILGPFLVITNLVPGTNDLRIEGPSNTQIVSIGPGSGSITKAGGGDLVIMGTNNSTGALNALGGRFVSFNGDCSSSSGIVVSNGVLLAYPSVLPSLTALTTNSAFQLGGILGIRNMTGKLEMRAGIMLFVIGGPPSGTTWTRLRVTGGVKLTSDTRLQINGGYGPAVGEAFLLVDNLGAEPVMGEFQGLPEGAVFTPNGSPCRISYRGGDGNDITITGVRETHVWTGTGPAKLWSVAANWLSNAPPNTGDGMLFPTFVTALTPTNDLPAFTRFDALTASNTYVFHGNAVELTGGFLLNNDTIFNPAVRLGLSQVWNTRSNFTVNGPVDLATNQINFAGGGSVIFSNNITGSTGAVMSLESLTALTFNGSNNFSGVTRMRGGVLAFNGPHFNSPVRVELADWTVAGTVVISNSSVAFSGSTSNRAAFEGRLLNGSLAITGGLFQVGAAAVISNSPTMLAGGTLSVLGQMPASPVTLIGGTLAGTGTVANVTAIGGTIAPGASPGRLRTGNLSLGTGATVELEIAGPLAGIHHDQLQVAGIVSVTNAILKLLLTDQTLSLGDTVVLIDNDGSDAVSGTFAGLPEGATFPLGLLDVRLSYVGGTGNDVTLTVIGLIPRATWTGAGDTNTWSTATNWARNTLPLNGDSLYFPPDVPQLTNVNTLGATSYAAIVFSGSNYWIQASNVALSAGIVAANPVGTNWVDSVLPGPSSVISNAPGNTLVLLGLYHDTSLNFLTYGHMEFRGEMSGSSNLVKSGSGTLHLYNTNSPYQGDLFLESGLTEALSAASLGSPFARHSASVSSGATLVLKGAGDYGEQFLLGGTLRISAPGVMFNGDNILTQSNGVYVIDPGASLTVAGRVSGAVGLRKEGPGEMTLTLTNEYTGGTFVNGGTLYVAGLATNAPAPSVFVNPGSTFRGGGPMGPVFVNQGILAPGYTASHAVMAPHDGISLNSLSTYRVRLSNVPPPYYDRIEVTGPVVLVAPQLQMVLDFRPPIASAFTLIANDGGDPVVGTFSGLPQNSFYTNGPVVFRVRYNGGSGNDVVVETDRYLGTGITRTWTGAGTNALWSTPQNWIGGVAPKSGDALYFPSGALQVTNQNDFASNSFFHALIFGGANYRLTGNGVALQGGCSATNPTGLNTLALPLAIVTNMMIRCEYPGATLAFEDTVDSNSRTVLFGGSGTVLGLGPVMGFGGVDAAGPGLAELRGTNTYTGETRASGGRLRFQNSALGLTGGGVVVTNGAVLELSATTNVVEDFTICGTVLFTNAPVIHVAGQFRFPSNCIGTFHVAADTLADVTASFASDGGGPAKEGPGDLYLLAADLKEDAYSGAAVINAGRLIFDSQTKGLTPKFGDLIVNSGGTLAVTGQVNHILVNAGGTLAPGLFKGVGALRPQQGLTFSPGSTLAVDLQGVDPSLDFDSIFVPGPVSLGNANLRVALGYDAVLISEYQLISKEGLDPVLGTFAGLPEGATFSTTNGTFRITYIGGDGNDVTLTRVATPPAVLSFTSLPNGSKQIVGIGEPGWFALIEATDSLVPPVSWELLDVQILDDTGTINFIDIDSPNHSRRFYRIRSP